MSRSPTKSTGTTVSLSSPSEESKSNLTRQLSSNSKETLSQLDYLDSYFASFASRVENIDQSIDLKKPQSLMTAKHDLAQIIGDLESLQANEIDGLTVHDLDSGKEEALLHRQHLNTEIENMLEQTQLLYKQIDVTLQRITANDEKKFSSPSSSSPSPSSPSKKDNSEPPLKREEIAKLLLLSSRAHTIQQINVQQWRALKDEICRRKGYLRDILRQSDISAVMAALASIKVS